MFDDINAHEGVHIEVDRTGAAATAKVLSTCFMTIALHPKVFSLEESTGEGRTHTQGTRPCLGD